MADVPTLGAGTLRARGMGWPRRGWALLDIRDSGEFERGHVPGATSLPRRMLEFRILDVLPDTGWPVVVYDSGEEGDRRAGLAAERLRGIGVADVAILAGGMRGWISAGGEAATGVNVPCKRFGEEILHADAVPVVTPGALARAGETGCDVLCDVRTGPEFADHHLEGAISLPGFELAAHLPVLARAHERIVVNCAGRTRSIIAAATARALGYPCAALENGTMGWRLAGGAVLGGAAAARPAADRADAGQVNVAARKLARARGVATIGADALAARRSRPGRSRPYVLDLRPTEAFRAGHVAGAISLPGGQAIQRTDDFLAVPGAPVVLVDDGDARAWLAAWWLRRMGFAEVSVLEGGMPAWRAAGHALAGGQGRTRPEAVDRLVAGVPVLGSEALKARLGSGAAPVLIDVSSSRAFAEAHVPGAIWISRGWLETEVARHASAADEIVVIAAEPMQARLGAGALRAAGYAQAVALDAGLREWAASGGPVQGGARPAHALDTVEPPYAGGLQAMRDYLAWETRLTGATPAQDATERSQT